MMKFVGVISERLDLYPVDTDVFLMRSQLPGTLLFTRDGSGTVTGFVIDLQKCGNIMAKRR